MRTFSIWTEGNLDRREVFGLRYDLAQASVDLLFEIPVSRNERGWPFGGWGGFKWGCEEDGARQVVRSLLGGQRQLQMASV